MAKRFEADYENFSYTNKDKLPEFFSKAKQLIDLAKQQLTSKNFY